MKNLQITLLLDFYGDLLTEKQFDAVQQYYNEDLSLAEIASKQGITRQGVRDSIKRAEALLFNTENRLGLARKLGNLNSDLTQILHYLNVIEEMNSRVIISEEINNSVDNIKKIINNLSDLY